MRAASANHDLVVTTIFVNPLQFAENEDLAGYPRDLAADTAAAETEGVDVLFVPSVAEMYPEPTVTTVHVARLTEGLCGAARPTHFDGVTTVVAKLFSIVGPCAAYFGPPTWLRSTASTARSSSRWQCRSARRASSTTSPCRSSVPRSRSTSA